MRIGQSKKPCCRPQGPWPCSGIVRWRREARLGECFAWRSAECTCHFPFFVRTEKGFPVPWSHRKISVLGWDGRVKRKNNELKRHLLHKLLQVFMEVVLPPASTKKMHQKEDWTCIQLPVNGAVRSLRQSVPMSLPNQLLPFCLLLKKSRYGLVRQVLFLRMFGPLFHRQSTVWLHRWMGRVMLKKTLITIEKKKYYCQWTRAIINTAKMF